MARDFLAVSGTGVSIERFFSYGPDLLVPKRRSMRDETARECLCLKAWLKSKNKIGLQESASNALAHKILGN